MAVNKGDIRTSANYDVQIQAPLDARAVRPTKADLINKESWSYDGSTIYAYEGMQVYVEDEKKTYYLKDISKLTAADYSGWELMGTGAGQEIEVIDNLNSTDTTAALSANQGKVIADELAGKQDLLMDGINIKTINGENITGRGNIVIEVGGTPVEVINSLESESTTSALSANQGRVLKEMINTNSGKKVYQFPAGLATSSVRNPYDFTEEEVADFLAAVSDLANTDFVLNRSAGTSNGVLLFNEKVNGDYDGTRMYIFDTAIGQSVMDSNDFDKINTYSILLIQDDAGIFGSFSTSTLEVDTEMSDTSMNPVQNKVIKEYVDNAVAGSGGGGGLETRILYVPEMTAAGSELTAEEKAYNVETVSKMLAGTARAALKVDLLDFFYYTTTNIVDLYGFGGVGAVISFGNPLGNMIVSSAFVISPEGDILLNIIDSPTINVGNAEVLEKLYWSIAYADATSRVPALYYNDILLQEVEVDADEVRAKGVYQDSSGKRVIRVTANQDGGEITEDVYPMEIYLTPSSSSELNNNKLWVSGYASSDSIKKPRILDNGVSLQAYYSLMIEVDSEQTHADFTIYRNGAFEVWRILASDGSASLIETIPISGGGSNNFIIPEGVFSSSAENPYILSEDEMMRMSDVMSNGGSLMRLNLTLGIMVQYSVFTGVLYALHYQEAGIDKYKAISTVRITTVAGSPALYHEFVDIEWTGNGN